VRKERTLSAIVASSLYAGTTTETGGA